jgi:zona occludens toxin (predicted ATPase)
MKTTIATVLFLICTYINSFGQDTSKLKNKKGHPEVKNFGAYTVTMYDGKATVTKNPNYDSSKALIRDTSTRFNFWHNLVAIYIANSNTPIFKRYLIYDLNSVSTTHILSRKEGLAKYQSRAVVDEVYLKSGIVPLNTADLLNKFSVAKKDDKLPIYVDYKLVVSSPDELLTVPDAVLKVDVIKDKDGIRFINIVTKSGDALRKKYAGQTIMHVR